MLWLCTLSTATCLRNKVVHNQRCTAICYMAQADRAAGHQYFLNMSAPFKRRGLAGRHGVVRDRHFQVVLQIRPPLIPAPEKEHITVSQPIRNASDEQSSTSYWHACAVPLEMQPEVLAVSRGAPCRSVVRRWLVFRVVVVDGSVLDLYIVEQVVRFVGQAAIRVHRPVCLAIGQCTNDDLRCPMSVAR